MKTNLPEKPAKPLKGRGCARVYFTFDRRMNCDKAKASYYDALPLEHRCEVLSYAGAKGNFNTSRCVSPEAAALWEEMNQ